MTSKDFRKEGSKVFARAVAVSVRRHAVDCLLLKLTYGFARAREEAIRGFSSFLGLWIDSALGPGFAFLGDLSCNRTVLRGHRHF